MAQLLTVDPATLPGPANNRNAAVTVATGTTPVPTPPIPPTTGQIWPRGG